MYSFVSAGTDAALLPVRIERLLCIEAYASVLAVALQQTICPSHVHLAIAVGGLPLRASAVAVADRRELFCWSGGDWDPPLDSVRFFGVPLSVTAVEFALSCSTANSNLELGLVTTFMDAHVNLTSNFFLQASCATTSHFVSILVLPQAKRTASHHRSTLCISDLSLDVHTSVAINPSF